MRWTCLQSNLKLVTFWTFLSDFWTIVTHPGLVFMSAVLLGFFCWFVFFFNYKVYRFIFRWRLGAFFQTHALYKLQKKNQKTASKVTKLGSKKQKWTQAMCLVEATTQALWHSALQPEHGPVGPLLCPAPSTWLTLEPSGAPACWCPTLHYMTTRVVLKPDSTSTSSWQGEWIPWWVISV